MTEILMVSQKIYSQVSRAENILLVSHQKPDADALGSLAAFGQWLDGLGKKHVKFCLDQPTSNLAWLLNFEYLITDPSQLIKQTYDLIVVLDSGDLKYAGLAEILAKFLTRPVIINIDHHVTNQDFGDINLVLPQAVSTTEIIYQLFCSLKVKVSPAMAKAMLAGIIYDTYNFTNPNTTYQSLAVASRLLLLGASLPQVSDAVLKNKDVETLKIWGEILITLSYNPQLKVVVAAIVTQESPTNLNKNEVTEGVANFLNNLTGVKAVLILEQQEGGLIKGSLRTNNDLIDVAKLAKMLGGGGHKKAAGFKIKGRLVQEENGVWQVS